MGRYDFIHAGVAGSGVFCFAEMRSLLRCTRRLTRAPVLRRGSLVAYASSECSIGLKIPLDYVEAMILLLLIRFLPTVTSRSEHHCVSSVAHRPKLRTQRCNCYHGLSASVNSKCPTPINLSYLASQSSHCVEVS